MRVAYSVQTYVFIYLSKNAVSHVEIRHPPLILLFFVPGRELL